MSTYANRAGRRALVLPKPQNLENTSAVTVLSDKITFETQTQTKSDPINTSTTTDFPLHLCDGLDSRAESSDALVKRRRYKHPEITGAPDSASIRDENARIESFPNLAGHLAFETLRKLSECSPTDPIHGCGKAPLAILKTRPDDVLALAHMKLHARPYREVDLCWRRLFEEATLYKAVEILNVYSQSNCAIAYEPPLKRTKLSQAQGHDHYGSSDVLDELVKILDKGRIMSGCPRRLSVFKSVFESLSSLPPDPYERSNIEYAFDINPCTITDTSHSIPQSEQGLSFEAFQNRLNKSDRPVVICGAVSDWPALEQWKRPGYFMQHTLNGRRLVPVEIGRSYVDEGWSQRLMAFRDFFRDYLLPDPPEEIGYLAQYDLIEQFDFLREDIRIPDYCYTIPPSRSACDGNCGKVGLLDQPLINSWFGPAGTKTPCHNDPYHNILAQVVGYKYIRLYSPQETPRLYPRGIDEKGIDMGNTASIDVGLVRPFVLGQKAAITSTEKGDVELAREQQRELFPLFEDATYQETVLGPGECLYIPLGWWHYVESLTISFSVSFWWN